jgi:hypothetical protein
LQAVKDINKHPENYQDSDKGELPANSKSIRKATDLNSNQVSYRMGGNSSSKGFAEDDNPLIIPHEPVRNENGFGPRSVELTSSGKAMLDTAQNQINEIAGIKREEFNKLRSKVESVESSDVKREEFEELKGDVDEYRDRAYMNYLKQQILLEALGIDPEFIDGDTPITEYPDGEEIREQIRATLLN